MTTILPNGAEYDSSINFFSMSVECQQYFYNIMNSGEPNVENDNFRRPIIETWNDTETEFIVQRVSEYCNNDPSNWSMSNQTNKIK